MKLISWNVNGLRACLTHDFAASFAALDADVFSVQETKMQPGQADFAPEGYQQFWNSAEKKKAVIDQSSQTIVALTTDKIPGVARFMVAKSRDIDVLVVEASLDQEAIAAFTAEDVRVISA